MTHNRKKIIFALLAAGGIAILVAVLLQPQRPKEIVKKTRKKPFNVILICLDTVRFDSFWFAEKAGYQDAFSAWGERALRFQKVQSPSTWTVPSVASVMTGLYPPQHGAGQFDAAIADLGSTPPTALSPDVTTLAEALAEKKYRTAMFVSPPWLEVMGLSQGIQEKRRGMNEVILSLTDRWLRARKRSKKPFFLYLHFVEAHLYNMRLRTLDPALQTQAEQMAPGDICGDKKSRVCLEYQSYLHAVLALRGTVAEILDKLQSTGIIDKTIVVLYSDHGEEFHDHLKSRNQLVAGPIPETLAHGHSMYQEVLHVPLLIWHPSYSGRDIQISASLVDIVPTLRDWLALKKWNAPFGGKSLAKIEDLDSQEDLKSRPLFSSGIAYGTNRTAVVWGVWKRIIDNASKKGVIFNLAEDPLESKPRQEPELQSQMDQLIAGYYSMKAQGQARAPELSEEELEKLQSLGYLVGAKPQDESEKK